MAPKITEKEWLEDFKDFVSSEGTPVPENISKRVLDHVHKSLNPSPWLIFAKLVGIHGVVGTLSLAICNQFGMDPFHTGISLSEYFMKFGHSACMFFCGFLFLSLSVLSAWILLKPEELRVFRKNVWIQLPSMALLSLTAFLILGAEIVLSIGVLWFVGAMAGGLATTYLTTRPLAVR